MIGFNVFDYVVFGSIIIAFLIGWSRGIVEVLTSFLAFILSAVLAGRFAPPLTQWLNKTWGLQDKIAESIVGKLHLPAEAFSAPATGITAEMLRGLPVPEAYKHALGMHGAEFARNSTQNAAQAVSGQLAGTVVHALVFFVLTGVLMFVLLRVGRAISQAIKAVPVIGTLNRVLGAAAIVLENVLFLSFIVGALGPVVSVVGAASVGSAIAQAWSTPHLMTMYTWLSRVPFGRAGLYFMM